MSDLRLPTRRSHKGAPPPLPPSSRLYQSQHQGSGTIAEGANEGEIDADGNAAGLAGDWALALGAGVPGVRFTSLFAPISAATAAARTARTKDAAAAASADNAGDFADPASAAASQAVAAGGAGGAMDALRSLAAGEAEKVARLRALEARVRQLEAAARETDRQRAA